MSQAEHVFISYVREDYKLVAKIYETLKESGIRVWLDRNDIAPGARWKRVIRRAISEGSFFLACFSSNYSKRSLTHMNEELVLAVDLLRKMPADRTWFIPVLLEDCEIPDLEIGGGDTLRDIQYVFLYQDWDAGVASLLSVLRPQGRGIDESAVKVDNGIIKILYLAADPVDLPRLRISEELREIQGAVMGSRQREKIFLQSIMAARVSDVVQSILSFSPQIVHISGHGSLGGLILESESGHGVPYYFEDVLKILTPFAEVVRCVVLSIYDSASLAKNLSEKIEYAIAINRVESASAFSAGFYSALAYGASFVEAYRFGCAQISLEGYSGEHLPLLFTRGNNG